MTSGWQGSRHVVKQIRPGASFKTGDLGQGTWGGGLPYNDSGSSIPWSIVRHQSWRDRGMARQRSLYTPAMLPTKTLNLLVELQAKGPTHEGKLQESGSVEIFDDMKSAWLSLKAKPVEGQCAGGAAVGIVRRGSSRRHGTTSVKSYTPRGP